MNMLSTLGMPMLWAALIVGFAVIEGMTLGLTSIWFAIGSIFALIAAMLKLPFLAQVIVFLLSSVVMLIYTKPIVQKQLKVGATKTNVEELIGMKGFVVKRISEHEPGQVKVKGQIWTAISEDGREIEVEQEIIVILVEGVKLIVK
ncbi:MAG: NfeD family protein [Clostridia bacterium]|nr:NfeD family protein [Clostridia bacterium]